MSVRLADRRRSYRMAASHHVVVRDKRGRMLARGRTANISENGAFVLVRCAKPPRQNTDGILEMTVPAFSGVRHKPGATRVLCFACRIVRVQQLGQLVGLGIELGEKLS